MFARWLARREDPEEEAPRALYIAAVGQARRVEFYRDWGVPDSVDGRFELIVLHVFLLLHRLKQAPGGGGERGGALGQRLFDLLFQDMDASLREMGVGDLGVGKRIKAMIQAFYGRVASYEAGLAEGEGALAGAVERNLLGTVAAAPGQPEALARYVAAAASTLDSQAIDELLAGRATFPDLPTR